jgi:sigma-E factor negative regulatory protein RseB
MSVPTPAHTSRFVPCAVLGALLLGPAWVLAAGDDPRVWLERMNHALATRNYDGIFMHVSGRSVETMRIVHRSLGGRVTERLASMDGSGREFVRNNDELTCYLPDKNTVLVQPRQTHGPFLGALPQFGAGVNDNYHIESLPPTRVIGHNVHVVAVNPKDQFRFGYRLWLDDKTAMPLKTQLCDARGDVIEQIVFAQLATPDTIPDKDLAPSVHADGMRWVRQIPGENAATDLASFRASHLPPGFTLTATGAQTIDGQSAPASHLVYSDGLATVSVFVEAGPAAAEAESPASFEGLEHYGSGYVFSTVVPGGYQVTAVGEVPAQTVQQIARSVRAMTDGGALAH